jgi:hypothetical protein
MDPLDFLGPPGGAAAPASNGDGDLWAYAQARAQELGVPVTLARNLIQTESRGDPNAVGPDTGKGRGRAKGATQVLDSTMRDMGYDPGTASPEEYVDAGLGYLKQNYDRFGSWEKALAAYHAGPGAVSKAGGVPGTSDGITTTADYVSRNMKGVSSPQAPGAGGAVRARALARPVGNDVLDFLDAGGDAPAAGDSAGPMDLDKLIADAAANRVPSTMERVKQGVGSTVRAGRLALTNDPQQVTKLISEGQQGALPASPAAREMATEIQPLADKYKESSGLQAVGAFAQIVAKRVTQFAKNPGEFIGSMAENLPNSAPGLAAGIAGGVAGSSVGGPLGGAAGAVLGGTAGGYGVEYGSDLESRVLEAARKAGVDPRDPQALQPIVQQQYEEFKAMARRKGLGTAGTDSLFNVLTLGAAGMGERALVKEANTIFKDLTAGTITGTTAAEKVAALSVASKRMEALQAAEAAHNTLGAKVARHVGVAAGEVAGEAGSEAIGEYAADGSIDPVQVIDEGLLALGQGAAISAAQHPLAKAIGLEPQVAHEESMARTMRTINEISAAPDVASAIHAAAQAQAGTGVVVPAMPAPEAPVATAAAAEQPIEQPGGAPEEGQRISALQAMADGDAEKQAQILASRGTANVQPNAPIAEGTLNEQMPQPTERARLMAKQAEVDKRRLAAGLATSTGVEPEAPAPLTPRQGNAFKAGDTTRGITLVDQTPMDPRQAQNRLTVLRSELQLKGGDPQSLQIIPHPEVKGKLAIRSTDNTHRYTPTAQGNRALAGDAGVGQVSPDINPVRAYVDTKRKEATPAARAFVRDYETGRISDADVQGLMQREAAQQEQERTAPVLTYVNGQPLVGVPARGASAPVGAAQKLRTKEAGVTVGETTHPEGGTRTTDHRGMTEERRKTIAEGFARPPAIPGVTEPPTTTETPTTQTTATDDEPPSTEVPTEKPKVGTSNPTYVAGQENDPPPPPGHPRGTQWAAELPARTDNPALRKLVEARDKKGIATFLAGHPNPVIAHVGRLMLQNKHFQFLDPRKASWQPGVAGYYHPVDDEIAIAPKYAGSEHVVTHEVVHGLTSRAMRAPQNERQRQLLAKAQALFKHLSRQPGANQWYGMTNERELMSEAFTNRDFQAWLATINYGKTSAWSRFVQMIADFLGLKDKSALTEVLELGTKIAEAQLKSHPQMKGIGRLRREHGSKNTEIDYSHEGTTLTHDEQGMPEIHTSSVSIGLARPFDVVEFIPTADNQQMLNLAITSPEGEYLGWTNVLFVDGKPKALYDIDIDSKKAGTGTEVVKAILDTTADGKLDISNIVPAARGFWEKLGIGQQNVEDTAAYDGTITRESFASSPAGAKREAALGVDASRAQTSAANQPLEHASVTEDGITRRMFVAGAAAAAAPGSLAATPGRVGRAVPLSQAVMGKAVDERVAKVLRGTGSEDPEGARTLKRAMLMIAESGPKEVRQVAATIAKLLPDEGLRLKVDDVHRLNLHGGTTWATRRR